MVTELPSPSFEGVSPGTAAGMLTVDKASNVSFIALCKSLDLAVSFKCTNAASLETYLSRALLIKTALSRVGPSVL